MKTKIKISSLYIEIIITLLFSAAAALLFFFAADQIVNLVLDKYIEESGYLQKCSDKRAEALQDFAEKNSVSSKELSRLEKWLSRNREVDLLVYDGTSLIYNSRGDIFEGEEYEHYIEVFFPQSGNYEIRFADKTLTVRISGVYDYSLYNTAVIVDILLSAAVFLVVFIIAIRSKVRYIRKLRQEIQVLEGGSLDCNITVSGNDELADLADGLNSMRLSFIKQMQDAEYLAQTNRTIVSEVSHDLRTPLTAVLLYSEILQNDTSLSDEQRERYIEKIVKKLRHMEELSDKLLNYAAESAPEETRQRTSVLPLKQALFDELSELCSYLAEQGFDTDFKADWRDVMICADEESVSRVFNNISSNICKYADKSVPVTIRIDHSEKHVVLTVKNLIQKNADKSGSKGIGTGSITDTMRALGGYADFSENDWRYVVRIGFKVEKKNVVKN